MGLSLSGDSRQVELNEAKPECFVFKLRPTRASTRQRLAACSAGAHPRFGANVGRGYLLRTGVAGELFVRRPIQGGHK